MALQDHCSQQLGVSVVSVDIGTFWVEHIDDLDESSYRGVLVFSILVCILLQTVLMVTAY